MSKVMQVEDAVKLVRNGDTVTVTGVVGTLVPEKILSVLEVSFLTEGTPRELTLLYPITVGHGDVDGLEHFAHEGMVRRIIGTTYLSQGRCPKLCELASENKAEAYCFPLGVTFHLLREIAAGKPGLFTKVGLGTFADPRHEGGKFNDVTTEPLVKYYNLDGEEWLFYKALPIDVAIIRGTTADEDGNISMEEEPVTLGVLTQAMAARNSGGKVIAQVKRVAARGSIHPRLVAVPGIFVDAIVVDEEQRQQAQFREYDPGISGEIRAPLPRVKPMPMDIVKVICRRAAMEMKAGEVVNLGGGIPLNGAISLVALEEGIDQLVTFSIEHGVLGGVNIASHVHVNPQAFLSSPDIMDFYIGGGLDVTFLGFGQADSDGNVNLTRMGSFIAGPGGAMDIAHKTKRVVFCGTFTYGGLEVKIENGRPIIMREGRAKKFLNRVQAITFSGHYGRQKDQQVLIVTERAVLRSEPSGLVVTEIAPGVDLKRDVLGQAECELIVAHDLKEMDRRIFAEQPMGLRDWLLSRR